jgi:outer membrane murein-binding lipoprotein Lpp
VEFLVGAEEAQATMLNTIISQATTALDVQKTEAAAALAAKEEELNSEITKLSGEVETAKGEATAALEKANTIKEEFGNGEQQAQEADLQALQEDATLEGQNIASGVERMLSRINK